MTERDDAAYLKHTLAHHRSHGDPRIEYLDVVITKSVPGARVYGGEPS
jgi:fumarate reductase flavoprotein subunit